MRECVRPSLRCSIRLSIGRVSIMLSHLRPLGDLGVIKRVEEARKSRRGQIFQVRIILRPAGRPLLKGPSARPSVRP